MREKFATYCLTDTFYIKNKEKSRYIRNYSIININLRAIV